MRFLALILLILATNVQAAQGQVTVTIILPDNLQCLLGRLPPEDCEDQDEDDQGMDEMNAAPSEPITETYTVDGVPTQITL